VRLVVDRERVVDTRRVFVRERMGAGFARREVRDRLGVAGDVPLDDERSVAERCASVMTCIRGCPCICGGRAVSSVAVN